MEHENNRAWRLYVIPDLRSWAENKNKTPIEYFDTLEQAKARFNELRGKQYNSESVSSMDGAPAARLTIGINNGKTHAAADIIHVRGGENVLSEDFLHSREITDDNSSISLIKRITDELGVDKAMVRHVSENGRYGDPVLVPFDKWADEHDFPIDKTFAYKIGHSEPFTVVHLDISTQKRKSAVSAALKNIIDAYTDANGRARDGAQTPYKNLLEQIKPEAMFIHASQGHLICLKYALRNAREDKELCMSMLNSIKQAEKNPTPVVTIKGFECILTDSWEDHGVTCNVGQSVDDISFYYARASDGVVTREYEYDHKPDREEVVSDHYDKLAEEDIDRSEAIYGADGSRAFGNTVEHILQKDIFNKPNADPSATRGEKEYIMDTKLECTSMVMLAEGSKAKAVATVTVNDEFVLKGIKVYDSANGLFVSMPSRKFGNEYSDVVFPITKEAREQLNSAVLGSYGKLLESGLDKLQTEKREAPEKSASKISVSLHQTDNEHTKAVGQVVIDDCLVISGVKVNHGANAEGIEKDFVGMPSYQTQTGEYNEYAHPITKECYDKVQNAVLKAYETLQKTEYKGVKLSELGEKGAISSRYGLNNKFAENLMAELEKKGIPYSAKVAETTSLSVRSENKAAVNSLEKELSAAMKNTQQPKQEQKSVHSKPKSR